MTLKPGRTLDSSEVLRAENYPGTIREVALMQGTQYKTLEEALGEAGKKGYQVMGLGIVNLSNGAPDRNEPMPVLNLHDTAKPVIDRHDIADAIILTRQDQYYLYRFGQGFHHIP